ncbi:uncharacterized protein LOC142639680 [Castanea sativa]|uniref:uncharacterized protein LOC142639680 n=1 Tax=Castanea sativa TaxID=21020 RepID=UPI003F649EA3
MHVEEKLGWLEKDATQMWEFRECLSNCGLMDLGFMGQRYTWCNGRIGEQKTLIKLDRVVANDEWRSMFKESTVHHITMSTSDHCMLALFLKKKHPSRPVKKRFLFDAMWTRDDRCRQIIEEAWDPLRGDPEFTIQDRLKCCQVHLQGWNWKFLHKTTEETGSLKKEINETLVKEEVMWSQRSRVEWIRCKDRNTKFFHVTATQRQRKNRIEGLWASDGQWYEEKEKIEEIILDYFANIYSLEHPSDHVVNVIGLENQVTPEMNDTLLKPFRAEEITLNQMHSTKSPSPDDMSSIFY